MDGIGVVLRIGTEAGLPAGGDELVIEAALVGFNLSLAPGTARNRRPMTSPLTNARHVRNHNAWTGPD
jgi:hypothetical protein